MMASKGMPVLATFFTVNDHGIHLLRQCVSDFLLASNLDSQVNFKLLRGRYNVLLKFFCLYRLMNTVDTQ
jgi:hypothetical protein